MKKLTKQEFLEKVFDYENESEFKFKGDKPIVLKFGADWCAPCKSVEPILEQISKEYEGKVDFYSVDIVAEEQLAKDFQIKSIQAIYFIPNNDEPPQLAIGALPRDQILKAIYNFLHV